MIKADPLTTTCFKKLPQSSVLTILLSFGIWNELESWKVSISRCLVSWPQIKKVVLLECRLLILCNNNEPFLDQIVTCNKKWILYDNQWHPTQGLHWEEAPKHFPKPNLHPKKGHGHCLVVCCQPDPLQLSKFQRNHYIWEVCSADRWDTPKPAMPAAGIGQQKGPSSPQQLPKTHHITNDSKVKWIGLWSFCFVFLIEG